MNIITMPMTRDLALKLISKFVYEASDGYTKGMAVGFIKACNHSLLITDKELEELTNEVLHKHGG